MQLHQKKPTFLLCSKVKCSTSHLSLISLFLSATQGLSLIDAVNALSGADGDHTASKRVFLDFILVRNMTPCCSVSAGCVRGQLDANVLATAF